MERLPITVRKHRTIAPHSAMGSETELKQHGRRRRAYNLSETHSAITNDLKKEDSARRIAGERGALAAAKRGRETVVRGE